MFCSQCGTKTKPKAQFCHQCGNPIKGGASTTPSQHGKETGVRNWLQSFGAFLFIPLFAIIIVLLFWTNKESEKLNASSGNSSAQAKAPDMAAMGQVHQTLERLKKNVETNPEDLVAIDSLAVMYSIAGSFEKSKNYYQMHLDLEPDNKDIKIALALTHNNLGDNQKAISLIQEVLDKEPTYAFGLHYMAEIYASMHQHDEANQYWQKIIDTYPGTEMAKVARHRMEAHDEQ